MKKPYVPRRMLTVNMPLAAYERLEELSAKWGVTKTEVLVRLLNEENAGAEE